MSRPCHNFARLLSLCYGTSLLQGVSIGNPGMHHLKLTSRPGYRRAQLHQSTTVTENDEFVGDLKAGGDFIVNMSFTSSAGELSTWGVIVDSGSSNLAVSVTGCDGCGSSYTTTLTLDEDADETITVVYGASRATTTYWSGVEATSKVGFIGGPFVTTSSLAAITEASQFFDGEPYYYGIFGLAYPDLAQSFKKSGKDVTATPFLKTLNDEGKLASYAFAFQGCGSGAGRTGYLTLGGFLDSQVEGSVTYLPVQKYEDEYLYFIVSMESIAVGETTLNFSSKTLGGSIGGAIVDTGTTELLLPSSVVGTDVRDTGTLLYSLYEGWTGSSEYLALLKEWLEGGVESVENCAVFEVFLPSVAISLGSDDGTLYTLQLNGSNLIFEEAGFSGCYFAVDSSDDTIVGNVAMQGSIVIFDLDDNKVGFGEGANCSGNWINDYENDDEKNEESDDEFSIPLYGKIIVAILIFFFVIGCISMLYRCCKRHLSVVNSDNESDLNTTLVQDHEENELAGVREES